MSTKPTKSGGELINLGTVHLQVLADISNERLRQDIFVATGKFGWNCSNRGPLDSEKLSVLGEEFGEVAKEINERSKPGYKKRLRAELIQVAAVASAWAESLTDSEASLPSLASVQRSSPTTKETKCP